MRIDICMQFKYSQQTDFSRQKCFKMKFEFVLIMKNVSYYLTIETKKQQFFVSFMFNIFPLFFPANNLYGYAQSQLLPVGEYEWLDEEEIQNLDITELSATDTYGYIFEVDLCYPTHLHASHSGFPMAPYRMKITNNELSQYAKGKYKKYYFPRVGLEPTTSDL